MKSKLYRDNLCYPKGTIFYLIAGIHHTESGALGRSDSNLTAQFHQTLTSYLMNFCGERDCVQCNLYAHKIEKCKSNKSIWKEYDYEVDLVPIYTMGENGSFDLTAVSNQEITKNLARKLHSQKQPSTLIFASCFSELSTVTKMMISYGILAILNILKDMGENLEVAEGQMYCLDEVQKSVINKMKLVSNFFLQLLVLPITFTFHRDFILT